MRLQHKFGVTFIQIGLGLNLFAPLLSHALNFDPVHIDSSRGEPLYAEIPFRNAQSQTPIKVSIAQPFEVGRNAVLDEAQYSHLNFYVRQNPQGDGVIVITSTRVIDANSVDLMLKIDDAGQVRMQQVRAALPTRIDRLKTSLNDTPLKPRYVANDQDIKLKLPEVTPLKNEKQLQIANSAPPMMQASKPIQAQNLATTPSPAVTTASTTNSQAVAVQTAPLQTTQNNVAQTANQQAVSQQATAPTSVQRTTAPSMTPMRSAADILPAQLTINVTRHADTASQNNVSTVQANQAKPQPTTQPTAQKPIVQKQVAQTASQQVTKKSNVAKQTAQVKPPIKKSQEKVQSKKSQQSATTAKSKHQVKANESLWGIANQIAEKQNIPVGQVMQQIQANNQHAFIGGNANQLKQGAVLNIPYEYQSVAAVNKPTQQPATKPVQAPQAPTTIAKAEKQSQAHMSIVAGDSKGTTQGSKAKGGDQKVSNELTVQLKQQRQNALNLQNNVRKLDRELVAKEKRIALLNARLAEIEQQLKQRKSKSQSAEKNTSQTSSQSKAHQAIASQNYTALHAPIHTNPSVYQYHLAQFQESV
ncbi:FimV N-terminal domain-containing protein [Acinetobacter marinus]|uniref:FimV N-terminal domain-containing protein n=1 Tax=Acinetobacter marinus TaxID=281375 RepID=A0A1G6N699_9GAMM|nr:FimV/HubP family polar landmark protein [Acinetobacter marinus]SDC63388.1 FimV N-terminal domain-containing protein [Acinetobacter marinus]